MPSHALEEKLRRLVRHPRMQGWYRGGRHGGSSSPSSLRNLVGRPDSCCTPRPLPQGLAGRSPRPAAAAKRAKVTFALYFPRPPYGGARYTAVRGKDDLLNFTGLLLGHHGTTIQRLQRLSGCKIEVRRPAPPPPPPPPPLLPSTTLPPRSAALRTPLSRRPPIHPMPCPCRSTAGTGT